MTVANCVTMQLSLLICATIILVCADAFITGQARVSSLKTPFSQPGMKRGGELENSHWLQGANSNWLQDANPNEGFPDHPARGFDKAPPKSSLATLDKDQSGTAAAWILNIVEVAHWLIVLPTFLGSYAVGLNHDFWLNMYEGSELRVLLWCFAPFFSFVAALPAFVMHTYESWQVAPFRNPIDGDFLLQDYNNGWMRAIVYKYLLIFQSIGLLMANHGYEGFGTVGISVALVLLSYIGDSSTKATFEFNHQPVFPVPIVVMPLLIWSVACNLLVSINLASHIHGDVLVHSGLLLSPVLIAVGGIVEGVIAESTFNQWTHLFAVIILLAGSSLQCYSLFQAPGLFV